MSIMILDISQHLLDMNLQLQRILRVVTLHRNVIFNSSKAPIRPWTRIDSINPEDLWTWQDKLTR